MHLCKYLLLLLLYIGTLLSCTQNKFIASNSYDILYGVEAYNAQFKNKSLTVYHSANLSTIVQDKAFHYIASNYNQNTKSILEEAMPLSLPSSPSSPLINNADNNAKLFSFSLPLLIQLTTAPTLFESDNSRISLSQLQNISASSITYINEAYQFGFYPIDDSFSDMFETSQSEFDWLTQAGLNNEEIQTFYKNHYGPASLIAKLLDTNITYKFISSYTFYSLPEDVQSRFTVHLLTLSDGMVPAITPLYLGLVNHNTTRNNFSVDFIKWMFTEEAQQSIIELKKTFDNNPSTLFISNHLSSLWAINTSYIFSDNSWLMDNQPLVSQIVVLRK